MGGIIAAVLCMAACQEKDMSMRMNNPRNIRGVVSYKRSFNDLNDVQLAVAKKIGIRPVETREEAEREKGRLLEIAACERYGLDSLTHSIPFLVPKAVALLDTIGSNFLDSLENKGLNPNKVIVTSVLRTRQDVNADTLKLVLSEVLRDLRTAGRCYVKYELKQGCFHITAR